MAIEYESPEKIAEYLTMVSTESMGLSAARDHDMDVAKLIMEVKESIGL